MSHRIAFLTRPCEHERENGDAVVVLRNNGHVLLAVIDALGHGPLAAQVARVAVRALEEHGAEHTALGAVQMLHSALDGMRGAAALVCTVSGGRIEACGVGNVEMRVRGAKVPIMLSPGILGSHVRRFRSFSAILDVPTRLVIYSDGISARFSFDELDTLSPSAACERLFGTRARAHDDASVLVADLSPPAAALGR